MREPIGRHRRHGHSADRDKTHNRRRQENRAGHMMRMTGDNDMSEAGYAARC
jgi:hypothetical protein